MRVLIAAIALVASGCLSWLPHPTPMPEVDDPINPKVPAKCLAILLPGAGDRAPIYRDEGFVAAIRKTGLSVDLIAADASPGYYANGEMPLRLETDILAPARAKGYQQIWLIGISMGAFGTFHYSAQYPEHVDGIFAMSPWLGRESTIAEIEAAGGLAMWKPPAIEPTVEDDNFTPQTWGYVARVTSGATVGPEIYLGWGDTDARVGSPQFLADVLPPGHVFKAPGGHDWPTWHSLFEQFLAQSDFKERCAR